MKNNYRILLLGRPGCGKTTIGNLLVDAIENIKQYDVGQILRDRKNLEVKKVHEEGGIVESNFVMDIFEDALKQNQFILIGSPRRPEEAYFFLQSEEWKKNPGFLVYLNLSEEKCLERLLNRKREDDSSEVINKRMKDFNEITKLSIDIFEENDRLIKIDVNNFQTNEEIVSQILRSYFLINNIDLSILNDIKEERLIKFGSE